MSTILLSFRILHNWEESFVANELCLSLAEYQALELGKVKLHPEVCANLSKLYKAPPHVFMAVDSAYCYSIVYSQCHFENSSGYVNHSHGDGANLKEFFQILYDEIFRLRKENDRLVNLLNRKVNQNEQKE